MGQRVAMAKQKKRKVDRAAEKLTKSMMGCIKKHGGKGKAFEKCMFKAQAKHFGSLLFSGGKEK